MKKKNKIINNYKNNPIIVTPPIVHQATEYQNNNLIYQNLIIHLIDFIQ